MPEPTAASDRLFVQQAEEHRRIGQVQEALKLLEGGLERNPGYLPARVAHARCLLDLGRIRDAAHGLEQTLERDPTHLVARKLLVETHLRQNDPAKARRQLDMYTSLNPGDPDIDALRRRIQDLLLADPIPVRTEVRVPRPTVQAPAVEPAPRNGSPRTDGHDVKRLHAEPFPELAARRIPPDYWQRLAGEGLFPVVAGEVVVAVFPTAETKRDDDTLIERVVPHPVPTPALEPLPPVELEDALWPSDEIDVAPDLDEETVVEAPAHPFEPARPVSATVTLGELYLSQGHYDEAEQIFTSVLREEPNNTSARVGLESVALHLQQQVVEAPPAVAASHSAGHAAQRKVQMLQRYLAAFKGRGRHVS